MGRGHWTIEYRLHCRDGTWREDASQIRRGNAPRAMASPRNIAITILRLEGETNLANATRNTRYYPHRAQTRRPKYLSDFAEALTHQRPGPVPSVNW